MGEDWELMDAPTPCANCARVVELDSMYPQDPEAGSSLLICRRCHLRDEEELGIDPDEAPPPMPDDEGPEDEEDQEDEDQLEGGTEVLEELIREELRGAILVGAHGNDLDLVAQARAINEEMRPLIVHLADALESRRADLDFALGTCAQMREALECASNAIYTASAVVPPEVHEALTAAQGVVCSALSTTAGTGWIGPAVVKGIASVRDRLESAVLNGADGLALLDIVREFTPLLWDWEVRGDGK